jgi:hypothetical protein
LSATTIAIFYDEELMTPRSSEEGCGFKSLIVTRMFLPKWLERTAATSYRLGSGEAKLGLFTSKGSVSLPAWNARLEYERE